MRIGGSGGISKTTSETGDYALGVWLELAVELLEAKHCSEIVTFLVADCETSEQVRCKMPVAPSFPDVLM